MLSKLRLAGFVRIVAAFAPAPAAAVPVAPSARFVAAGWSKCPDGRPEGLQRAAACGLQCGVRVTEPGQTSGGSTGGASADDTSVLLPQDGEPEAKSLH